MILQRVIAFFAVSRPRGAASATRHDSKLLIDIGANIGLYTSTLGNLGHSVIAVEPFARNLAPLLSTVCRYGSLVSSSCDLFSI